MKGLADKMPFNRLSYSMHMGVDVPLGRKRDFLIPLHTLNNLW